MWTINPAILALVVNSAGYYLYGPCPLSYSADGKQIPLVIFATAVCLLITSTRKFDNLFCRSSPAPFQFIWKYLAVAYILEQLINNVWIPFEITVSTAIPELADSMENMCESDGSVFACGIFRVLDVFGLLCESNVLPVVIATVFLVCSLHMTNLVNVKILFRCGPRRLIALLLQHIMRLVGIQKLACEEDILKACRPSGDGCGLEYGSPEKAAPLPWPSSHPLCRKLPHALQQ